MKYLLCLTLALVACTSVPQEMEDLAPIKSDLSPESVPDMMQSEDIARPTDCTYINVAAWCVAGIHCDLRAIIDNQLAWCDCQTDNTWICYLKTNKPDMSKWDLSEKED